MIFFPCYLSMYFIQSESRLDEFFSLQHIIDNIIEIHESLFFSIHTLLKKE